jgi:uncharacterized protein YkwD
VLLLAPSLANAACPGANAGPSRPLAGLERHAVVCLIDQERASHGLAPLRVNRRLGHAARVHSRDMVRRGYFEHTSPGGATFSSRIERAGYLRGARGWALGETLAWGSGRDGTAAALVRAWMDSPEHRDILLDPSFRDLGVGVAMGAPGEPAGGAVTLTADFGRRR